MFIYQKLEKARINMFFNYYQLNVLEFKFKANSKNIFFSLKLN